MAKDNIVPFTALVQEPIPENDIRIEFRKMMIELFKAEEQNYRSVPISQLLKGLGKTCTKLKDRYPKEVCRIALKDYYGLAGIFVTKNGAILFNTH